MPRTKPLNWVYKLQKRPLIGELASRGLNTKGNVAEMRARLVEYLREHPDSDSRKEKADTSLSSGGLSRHKSPLVDKHEQLEQQSRMPQTSAGQTCDLVRKWGLKFDGVEGVVGFIERLIELKTAYKFSEDNLLIAIPELLKGKALLWYRNNKDEWHNWGDFISDLRKSFLPPDYTAILEDDIRKRTQGQDESIMDFVISLRTEMRRHGGMTPRRQLEMIYKNLRPEYKTYIRRRDFSSLSELLEIGTEYEYHCREAKMFRPPPNPAQSPFTDTAYRARMSRPPERRPPVIASTRPADTQTTAPRAQPDTCWNCSRTGHRYSECRSPRKLFCYRCGEKGETVKTCRCQTQASGNARRP